MLSQRTLALLAALTIITLVSCTDDDSERRFANDPHPTEEMIEVSPTPSLVPVTPEPTVVPATPLTIEQLLTAAGGLDVLYLRVGDSLVAFNVAQAEPRRIWQAQDRELLAHAVSPSGDRVALLVAGRTGREPRLSVVILSRDGRQLRTFDGLERLVDGAAATPIAQAAGGQYDIDWSPRGDRLLVGFATGGIAELPLDGEPALLLGADTARAPGQLAWSPTGEAIAFIDPALPGVSAGLYVASLGAPLDPVAVVSPAADSRRTIGRMTWLSSGNEILFSLAPVGHDHTVSGDLFAVPVAGGAPRLVAAAARVAPVSAIGTFAPSPDGDAVAYTVVAPGDDATRFESLWVQQIDADDAIRLPVPTGEHVADLWWTTAGLVWRTEPATSDARKTWALYLAERDGSVALLYREPGEPSGTPVASPMASPSASPAASPMSSPDASPALSSGVTPVE